MRESFEEQFRRYGIEIADHLSEMPKAKPAERRKLFLAIVLLLSNLRLFLRRRLTQVFRDFAKAEQQRLLASSNFPKEALDAALLSDSQINLLTEAAYSSAVGYLGRSLTAIQGLASTLQTSNDPRALQRIVGKTDSPIETQKWLREKLVAILAANGRYYRYEPGYYAEIVRKATEGELSKRIVRTQARILGSDLVQIVGPESQHGFCAKVLNRVFSLSGTHAVAKPVSLIGGPAPFHISCTHSTVVFSEAGVSAAELLALTTIPEDLLSIRSTTV
jgi:hypothetical protein